MTAGSQRLSSGWYQVVGRGSSFFEQVDQAIQISRGGPAVGWQGDEVSGNAPGAWSLEGVWRQLELQGAYIPEA